jgi:type I restriction-modification system DNA methylase subunit
MTTPELAERLARDAFARFFYPHVRYDGRPITVLDPAAGEGALLVAAANEFARRLALFRPDHEREAAQRYWLGVFGSGRVLRGIEVDAARADLAREALVSLTGSERAADGIVTADALFTDWPRSTLVMANPPYLGGGKISGLLGAEYRKRLVKQFPLLKGTANLATCWLAKSQQQGATVASWILPMACAQGDSRQAGLRPLLVDHGWRITQADTDIPFPGAGVNVALVHMDRLPPPFDGTAWLREQEEKDRQRLDRAKVCEAAE